MIGQLLIHVLFGCAIGTTVLYGIAWFRKNEAVLPSARFLFIALTIGLLTAAGMLVTNIVQHNFDYHYVWNYSSKELPLHLLIACAYSGQEGSFLLWTLLVAIIGWGLMGYAKRHDYEKPAMLMYGIILSFLTLLLVAKNPFAFFYETLASQGITQLDVPPNGRGLNPLLHNGWITIHPPILFSGFAAMSVSFAFAMAGLLKRDYHKWITIALPWTLFATAVLGFGIMLGGFWAYETLGWGGFWGWDPVENSSLIPWLVSVALVHTMLVQKRTKGLVKTNMILAVLSFVMVLYSTFLTRSGILGDTSVHSFVDPGKFAFWILLAFMATFVIIGVTMVLLRRKDMNIAREDFSPLTREFMLSIGSALVMASAVFVTIGTSWPVLLEIIGQPKVAVAVDFYNKVHLVLVPAILVVNGLAMILKWRTSPRTEFLKSTVIALGITAVLTLITNRVGITNTGSIVLAAGAWFSLILNLQMGIKLIRSSVAMLGAYVSHLGIALLMFGVITSSSYTEAHHVSLVQGIPTQAGGYTLTYLGKEQVELQFKDREKYKYNISIKKDGTEKEVAAVLYWSDYNKRSSPFNEPGIRWGLANDLYISPKAIDTYRGYTSVPIQRGGTITASIDTSIRVTLERFTMPMEEGTSANGNMQMAAVLRINGQELKSRTEIIQSPSGMEFNPEWTLIPGTSIGVGLTEIQRNNQDPTKSMGALAFRDMNKPLPSPRDEFTIEFSVKPLISLVWFGVLTMVLGFVFSIVRYSRQTKKQELLSSTQFSPSTLG